MPKPSARELLNLPEGYRVRRYRKGELDVAWVDTGREPDRRCPRCGARGHVNGTAERSVSRLPVQTRPLALKMKVTRLRCPKCGRCWSGVPAIVSDVSPHVTADLADAMAYDLMDRATVTEVAARYGLSPHIAVTANLRFTV
ncbi:transposase family protein [Collinsella tanakaei]|nr:transposase family protein [Collinsella tanakaei]